MGALVVEDRRLQADRPLGEQDLAHFFERHRQLFGEFLSARLAADLLQHLARGPRQLEDGLDKVSGMRVMRSSISSRSGIARPQSCCHGGIRMSSTMIQASR